MPPAPPPPRDTAGSGWDEDTWDDNEWDDTEWDEAESEHLPYGVDPRWHAFDYAETVPYHQHVPLHTAYLQTGASLPPPPPPPPRSDVGGASAPHGGLGGASAHHVGVGGASANHDGVDSAGARGSVSNMPDLSKILLSPVASTPEETARLEKLRGMETKERNAAYNKFKRQMNSPFECKQADPEMLSIWSQAVASKNRRMTTAMFEHFTMVGGDFKSMKVSMKLTRTTVHSNLDKDGWLTISQIAKMYGLPYVHVSIVKMTDRKRALGLCRMHPEAPDDDFMTLFDCKMEMSKQTVEAAAMDRTLSTELIVDDQDTAARVLVASRGMFDEMTLPGLPANQASAASNGYNNLYEGSLQFPMCRGSRLADDWADGNHRHCASSESGTPQKDPAATKDDPKKESAPAGGGASAESYEVMMEKARLELATQAEIVKAEKKKKNDERKLKLKDVRMKDPVVLAKHWADLIVADLTDAKKLVLKLQEDKLSSALTTELHQMNTELEKHFVTLQKFATGVEKASPELVATAVEGAQAVIDQMRPLFDRGEASADEEFMDESNEDIAVRETETQHLMGL